MNLKRKIIRQQPAYHHVHFLDNDAVDTLSRQIHALLPLNRRRAIVIVCIGTDRSTGDALGPIIGSELRQKPFSPFHIYGTLDAPVHAVNLEKHLATIEARHSRPFVIGIDASLGKHGNVGLISVDEGPLRPGAGVKKQLPSVGEAHITGVVNVSGSMEYFVLQNTRLNLVMQMADVIADSLYIACLNREAPLRFSRKTDGFTSGKQPRRAEG